MAAPFPRWSTTGFRVALVVLFGGAVGSLVLFMIYQRTPYITDVGVPIEQPIMFDHRHHVVDDGIDCRYCHYTVEKERSAGMPPTSLCMNCHNQIWNSSPLLEPVRRSYFTGKAIEWRRVHDLPAFVYFDHSIHVNKGVGCESCHGRIDEMAQVEKHENLQMSWCLDCHRHPELHLRPRDQVTSMTYQPPADQKQLGLELVKQYDVKSLTHCSACHR